MARIIKIKDEAVFQAEETNFANKTIIEYGKIRKPYRGS